MRDYKIVVCLNIVSEHSEISIVIPVYRAERIIDELCKRLKQHVSQISEHYEIILIDDCSPDNSWNKISEKANKDKRIKGYQLSRNFGQHHAITAGLDQCNGKWIVVMDCDLQDRPEEIVRLHKKAQEGFDIVLSARKRRKDGFFKRITSKLFYLFLSALSGLKFNGEIGNFGIYSSQVIEEAKQIREPFRFFVSTIKWLGFKTTSIDVEHDFRFEGKSSYNYKKLFSLAANIIISYSNKPLKILIYIGFTFSIGAIFFIAYNIFLKLTGEITELGYTSLISSIWLLSGIIIASMGVLGIYIGKIYDGIKSRPLYVISNKTNN